MNLERPVLYEPVFFITETCQVNLAIEHVTFYNAAMSAETRTHRINYDLGRVGPVEVYDTANFLSDVSTHSHSKRKILPRQVTIYNEGFPVNGLHLVHSGQIFLKTESEQTSEDVILAIAKKGSVIGIESLLQHDEYSNTATTQEQAELQVLSRNTLLELAHDAPALYLGLVYLALEQQQQIIKHIQTLVKYPVPTRVGLALLDFMNPETNTISVTNDVLARRAGTTRTSVINVCQDLKARGILSTERMNVGKGSPTKKTILQPDALQVE